MSANMVQCWKLQLPDVVAPAPVPHALHGLCLVPVRRDSVAYHLRQVLDVHVCIRLSALISCLRLILHTQTTRTCIYIFSCWRPVMMLALSVAPSLYPSPNKMKLFGYVSALEQPLPTNVFTKNKLIKQHGVALPQT